MNQAENTDFLDVKPMETVSQRIAEDAESLLEDIKELLGEKNILLTDLNVEYGVFIAGPHYAFPKLDDLEKSASSPV